MPNNTYIDENIILSYFETGDFPTQAQFAASWTSYWHKSATIPQSSIENLSLTLQGFADKTQFENHLQDADAHSNSLLKLDASNITDIYREQLRNALGVGDIPNNVALVDVGESQDVFNKSQINELCLLIADFVTAGKIRADKIEALGLTEIHEVTETTLVTFAANSANYEFEKNDIIAVPDGNGNFSLFIYKGGTKTVVGNYLPTGLTNITISMVEGLQTALDKKIDKPTATGNYFINHNGVTSLLEINPTASYLLFWNGSGFSASSAYYRNNKIGLGTETPTEMLHLENGRIRTKGVVFDVNSERLPGQLTFDGTHFFGTSSTGVKRIFMFNDYEDHKAFWQSLSESQRTELGTIANGGYTTNSMSVGLVSPPVIDQTQNQNSWVLLKGANLNLNPILFSVSIMAEDEVTVIAVVPNSQVQLNSNGIDLMFYFNFNTLPIGNYKIRLWNGVTTYTTQIIIISTNSLSILDLQNLTWQKAKNPVATNDTTIYNSSANGGQVNIYEANSNNFGLNAGASVESIRSSAIPNLTLNDNFYLKFTVNEVSTQTLLNAISETSFGLTTLNSAVAFTELPNIYRDLIRATMGGRVVNTQFNQSFSAQQTGYNTESKLEVELVKKGDIITETVFVRLVTHLGVIVQGIYTASGMITSTNDTIKFCVNSQRRFSGIENNQTYNLNFNAIGGYKF